MDKYKELQKLKEDCNVSAFLEVSKKADENDLGASVLLEQVKNYCKVKPTWSELTIRHAVVMCNISTRAYEHMRSEGILRLPSRSTLQRYLGFSAGEVGTLLTW